MVERRTESEFLLGLEVEFEGFFGELEKSRLVLSQISLNCQIKSQHFQNHKYSVLPFRLTSAIRYVLVLKDDIIDLETVCGNLHQAWSLCLRRM